MRSRQRGERVALANEIGVDEKGKKDIGNIILEIERLFNELGIVGKPKFAIDGVMFLPVKFTSIRQTDAIDRESWHQIVRLAGQIKKEVGSDKDGYKMIPAEYLASGQEVTDLQNQDLSDN